MRLGRGLRVASLALATGCACAAPAPAGFEAFIVERLAQSTVPGVAVAKISGHAIEWSAGFGFAHSLTRAPVAAGTPFPVASNGKPVAAWLAVQVAAEGRIALDASVRSQARAGLPDGADHQRITPRHLLAHTSGLGNFLRDRNRSLAAKPGAEFRYSGVGYMVLQELLEERHSTGLDTIARTRLFGPAGMQATGYGAPPDGAAVPHIELRHALAPFAILALPAFLAAMLAAAALHRAMRGTWRVPLPLAIGTAILVTTVAASILWQRSGSVLHSMWFTAVPLATIALALAVALLVRRRGRHIQALAVVVVAAVAALAARAPVPLPSAQVPNAASSMHASAPDLARFLVELSRPTLASREATLSMGEPQVALAGRSAWGLGIGIERHARGRDLWHWGANPGARSLMVICPETGDGVVVLANGGGGSDLVRAIAARVLGREGCWRPGC